MISRIKCTSAYNLKVITYDHVILLFFGSLQKLLSVRMLARMCLSQVIGTYIKLFHIEHHSSNITYFSLNKCSREFYLDIF